MSERAAFCVTSVADYNFAAETSGGTALQVRLPREDRLTCVSSSEGLWALNQPEQLVWVAGGGCYVLNDEWIPLIRRSANSPSNPGKLTICSGKADSISELYKPGMVIRELFEEIAILTHSGELVIPNLRCSALADDGFDPARLRDLLNPYLAMSGVHYRQTLMVHAYVDRSLTTDRVEVFRDDELISTTNCLLHYDQLSGATNLLYAVRLDLGDRDPKLLQLFDLEHTVMDGEMTALRRENYMFHIPTREVFRHEPGWSYRRSPVELEMTEHAVYLLERICQMFAK